MFDYYLFSINIYTHTTVTTAQSAEYKVKNYKLNFKITLNDSENSKTGF
jgi:hypothetical protein